MLLRQNKDVISYWYKKICLNWFGLLSATIGFEWAYTETENSQQCVFILIERYTRKQILVNYSVGHSVFLTTLGKRFAHLLQYYLFWLTMHCFLYSDDLFNIYCIQTISSLFLNIQKYGEEFFTIATSVSRQNGVLNSDKIMHCQI